MTNEPKTAPQTPAPNAANHFDKDAAIAKPDVVVPATAPVVPPVETKKD